MEALAYAQMTFLIPHRWKLNEKCFALNILELKLSLTAQAV